MDDGRGTASSQLMDVLSQLDVLLQHLPAAEDAVAAYEQRADRDFALAELFRELARMHESLQNAHLDLEAAASIVDEDQLVDVAYGNGGPWAGPQPPRYLFEMARRAADGTARASTSYRRRLDDRLLTEAMDPACPLERDGRPCTLQRVNRVGGTRASACWPHLSPAEKKEVTAERNVVIASTACAECGATSGAKCTDNGRPTSIHKRRLTSFGSKA